DDKFMTEAAMIKTNEEIINLLTPDKKLVSEILEFAKKQNFVKFLDLMKPETNIHLTLENLKSVNKKLAVFTNRGSSLEYLLKHFNMHQYFDFLVNSFAVSKPKPDPEGLIKILNFFGKKPENAIFIGDSINDYTPAKSTGTFFVSYKNKDLDAPVIDDHLKIMEYV
ncbi:MAG: HAD-IA family hydrolase, partial [Deferribacterales bacterium]